MDIVVHGKAYKPGVPYLEGSYSLLIGHYCKQLGVETKFVDPLTGNDFIPTKPSVFLLAHSPSTTYKYMTKEGDGTDTLYCEIPKGSIVVDPWRKFKSTDSRVIHYGNTRFI